VAVLGEEDGQGVADRSASDDRNVRVEAADGLVDRGKGHGCILFD
jgi:hypothetical protein